MKTVQYLKFKKWRLENGIKQKEIGEVLGVDETRISNKLNKRNGAKLTLEDVKKLCIHYKNKKLTSDIFF